MSPLKSFDGGFLFWCPGCREAHAIRIAGSPVWKWNGNEDRPTFTPSLLVTSGHFNPGANAGTCWCTFNAAHPDKTAPFRCLRCHSFITDGRIKYLADCSHSLAGQTIDMLPWKGWTNED